MPTLRHGGASADSDAAQLTKARERLVDERQKALREIEGKREELLTEMHKLVRMAREVSGSLHADGVLAEDDDDDIKEELDEFLGRFDFETPQGSITSFVLPELDLPEEDVSMDEVDDEEVDAQDDEEEPKPALARAESPETKVELIPGESDEDAGSDAEEQTQADHPSDAISNPRSSSEKNDAITKVEEVEESMDIDEDESPASENDPRVEPSRSDTGTDSEDETRQRSASHSTVPHKRKRLGSTSYTEAMEKVQPVTDDEDEALKSPSVETQRRQTRLRSSRKTETPPATVTEDDDEPEELGLPHAKSGAISHRVVASAIESVKGGDESKDMGAEEEVTDGNGASEMSGLAETGENLATQGSTDSASSQVVPATPSTQSQESQQPSQLLSAPVETVSTEPTKASSHIRHPDAISQSPPKTPAPPIIVKINLPPPTPQPVYSFLSNNSNKPISPGSIKQEPDENARKPLQTFPASQIVPSSFKKDMGLSLPPLSALPPEFDRRGKPQRSRRRDKDRGESGRRDDWIPLGMAKWSALLKANPVYAKLTRANKCLSTKEWNIASTELQLIKSFERIEALKEEDLWSFRQVKKSRIPAPQKTHWDYLMDEMKWMQTDFREERRWKIALAYELAVSAQEWHIAGSKEERIRLGITGLYRKPDPMDYVPTTADDVVDIPEQAEGVESDADEEEDEVVEIPSTEKSAEGTRDASEEEDAQEQRAVNDALAPDAVLIDALDDADQNPHVPVEAPIAPQQDESDITMKVEELDGAGALRFGQEPNGDVSMQQDQGQSKDQDDATTSQETVAKIEPSGQSLGLKEASSNPTLVPEDPSANEVQEVPAKEPKPILSAEDTKRLRVSLTSLPEDTLVVSIDELLSIPEEELFKSIAPSDDPMRASEWDPTAIFPELQAFGMTDVTTADIVGGPSTTVDGKRRNDRKLDRDDPSRRFDESMHNKLYPASRFMTMKPTLVSAMQPARKWRKGKWVDLDESPVVSDIDAPLPPIGSDISCSLFGNRRTISIGGGPLQPPLGARGEPRLSRSTNRMSNVAWSPGEDDLLRTFHERYPGNWRLVADALNSSRIRTNTDRRTPIEVYSRWHEKFAPQRPLMQPTALTPGTAPLFEEGSPSHPPVSTSMPPPPTPSASSVTSTPQMTTRGIQRKATNAAQAALNLSINTGTNTVENRKRKRHTTVNESMRKSMTKRTRARRQDEAKAHSSVMIQAHDTHNQFGTKQRMSPMELSIAKGEREEAERARRLELQHRRAAALYHQQQVAQQHAQHLQQAQAQAQAQAAQQQTQAQQAQQPQQSQQTPVQQAPAQAQLAQTQVQLQGQPQNAQQMRAQIGISQQQQQQRNPSVAGIPVSPQAMAQQRLLLAQAQAQAAAAQQAQAQSQPNMTQLPSQLQNMQATINGTNQQHIQANFMNQANTASPGMVAQTSPPRSTATPVNSTSAATNFQQRPPSAQRASAGLPGTSVLPMTNGQVPIARTNNMNSSQATATFQYLQNLPPDQLARLLTMSNNFQQQQMQAQQGQQQQQSMQMQNQPNMQQQFPQ